MPLIRLEKINFGYDRARVLDGIDLDVADGEFVAVIGPSGCGKSTLLRLLAGLAFPDAGAVTVDGAAITAPGLDRAVVFQDYSLFPWLSCRDNVVLALEQARLGRDKRDRREIAEKYLRLVGLAGDGEKLPGELSGGMRQRTAIARALAVNAPVLLMDEPFGALDEITRARQQDLLLELMSRGGGKTVLFVTHDVEEAVILADRVLVLSTHPGRIVRELTVDLPRPRSRSATLRHPRFNQLRDELLTELNRVIDDYLQPGGGDGAGI
ncbi:MAG: ABC transporter ATP-binding protein [Planctomycetota bacterium]|jgi:nitrate ABC transporter ATP-binding subunit|nr:ABC transporter ATP-binding protein [Planctomycetota bacterium]